MSFELVEFCEFESFEELHQWIDLFSENFIKGNEVVLLDGPMGTGKTHLVKRIVKNILKINDANSPTFVLNQIYSSPEFDVTISHWDLYRIKFEEELEATHFWQDIEEKKTVFIEWSEKININHLPASKSCIKIQTGF